jgi:hypothetical protein
MKLQNHYSKRLSLSILCLVLLIAAPWSASAQPSEENLAKAINEIMTQAYKPNEPGASIIVTRNGKVAFRKGYGMANLELAVPVEPDMIFRLGSVTKPITKDGTKLMAQSPGQPKLELFAVSQTKLFVKEAAIQIEFVVDGSGKATSLVLHQGGRQLPAKKIK